MKNAFAPARIRLALIQALLLAIPAGAGWTALAAPNIPEATAFRDWRGLETSRLIADDSGALYLYLGDTLYQGRNRGEDWSVLTTCPYGEASPVYRPILLYRDDWLVCNREISFDRGKEWREAPAEFVGMMWLTLMPGNRFLGSRFYGESLWLSPDSGSTFDQVGGMRGRYQDLADLGDGQYLVAGATSSSVAGMNTDMLYTPDGGLTWNPLVKPSGDSVEPVRAYVLATDPHPAAGTAYALSDSGSLARLNVIRWVGGVIHVATRSAGAGFPDSAVTCFRAVAIPGGAGTRLWLGTWGQGLFASDDGGLSWVRGNEGLSDLHVGGLAVSGADIFALTRDGLYRAMVTTGIRRGVLPERRGAAERKSDAALLFPGPGPDGRSGPGFRIDGRRAKAMAGQ
ncbi:MAG: hypothetical protein JF616_18685 [Fibrobacteres bacterium]|nr:hypothetical protein [Fibrobacterota bacterium]